MSEIADRNAAVRMLDDSLKGKVVTLIRSPNPGEIVLKTENDDIITFRAIDVISSGQGGELEITSQRAIQI